MNQDFMLPTITIIGLINFVPEMLKLLALIIVKLQTTQMIILENMKQMDVVLLAMLLIMLKKVQLGSLQAFHNVAYGKKTSCLGTP